MDRYYQLWKWNSFKFHWASAHWLFMAWSHTTCCWIFTFYPKQRRWLQRKNLWSNFIFEVILFYKRIYFENFKKKRVPIDGEIIKVGTTFYGRNLMTNSCTINNTRIHLRCDVRQLFKIDNCRIPFGLIIRVMKLRKLVDVPDAKKQRLFSICVTRGRGLQLQ